MILIQSEFYLSTAVTRMYQCIQQDVQRILRNSLPNGPSCVRDSENSREAVEEETFPGEIGLENRENN